MKIKLIAMDLDGTFVNKYNAVSEANAEAVKKAAAAGAKIVVSTGRVFSEIPDCVKQIAEIGCYITSNGGSVIDSSGKIILSDHLPKDVADKAMEIIMGCDCLPDIYVAGKAYMQKFDDSELGRYRLTPEDFIPFREHRIFVDDLMEFYKSCTESVEKINMFFGDMDQREYVIRRLGAISPMPQITYSMESALEISSANCTKGAALLKLCRKYGIFPQEIMAIGDSNNDISMLDIAGVSVAMGNAGQFVKKYAKYETDTCENDGVAKAIERFVL